MAKRRIASIGSDTFGLSKLFADAKKRSESMTPAEKEAAQRAAERLCQAEVDSHFNDFINNKIELDITVKHDDEN